MNYVAREHSSTSGLYVVHDFISETEETALLAYFDAAQWGTELKRRTQHYGYKYSYSHRKIDLSMKTDPIPQCAVDIAEKIEKVRRKDGSLIFDTCSSTQTVEKGILDEDCATNVDKPAATNSESVAVDNVAESVDMSLNSIAIENVPKNAEKNVATVAKKKTTRFDQLIVNEYEPGQGINAHIDCQPCFCDGIASLSLGSACVMQFRRLHFDNVDVVLPRRSLAILTKDARYSWTHAIPARKSDNGVARQRRVSLTFRQVILS